jgi:hypothetical protein
MTDTVDLKGIVYFRPEYAVMNNGNCQAVVEDWTDHIAPNHAADGLPPPYTLVYPTVGYLFLYDQNGTALPGGHAKNAIYQDAQLGRVTFLVQDLPPGTYIARAFIGYKGNDAVARVYDRFFNSTPGNESDTIIFTIEPPSIPGSQISLLVYLVLNGSVCPAL